jgi:hypothetical protein
MGILGTRESRLSQASFDPGGNPPALVQKLKEIGQNRGKALLGHLNISINLMIKPAPGKWTGPLEAITMRHGDCKSYSLARLYEKPT